MNSFFYNTEKYCAFYISTNTDEFFGNLQKYSLFYLHKHYLAGISYSKI